MAATQEKLVAKYTGPGRNCPKTRLLHAGSGGRKWLSYSWVEGSNFDDDLTVNDHYDSHYLYGLAGNDRLVAGYYTRLLSGGDGNDILDGRSSIYLDRLDGGAG